MVQVRLLPKHYLSIYLSISIYPSIALFTYGWWCRVSSSCLLLLLLLRAEPERSLIPHGNCWRSLSASTTDRDPVMLVRGHPRRARWVCSMLPTWSAWLVHYFFHSNKHTPPSSQRRTTSIVVAILSLEVHVLSPSSSSSFFFIWANKYIEWALCLVNCARYISLLRSLPILVLLRDTPWGAWRHLIIVSCLHALPAHTHKMHVRKWTCY